MEFCIAAAIYVFDPDTTDCEGVADQGTVTTPGDGFGAHDGRRLLDAQLDQFLQGFFEIRRLHVVSKPAEGGVSPAHIGRIRPGVP